MNAVEFVKKFGWEEARRLLSINKPKTLDIYYYGWGFYTIDLKRLVDSYNLVQSNGGIEMARQYLGNKSVLAWDALDGQLSQAICEVEKCQ